MKIELNAAARLKHAINAASLEEELAKFEFGKKVLNAMKKSKGKGPDFSVTLEKFNLKKIPKEADLKKAKAEMPLGDLEEYGTKQISVVWHYSDGVPLVSFSGKNAEGEEVDPNEGNAAIEPVDNGYDPSMSEEELATYIKKMGEIVEKLKTL